MDLVINKCVTVLILETYLSIVSVTVQQTYIWTNQDQGSRGQRSTGTRRRAAITDYVCIEMRLKTSKLC